MKRFSAAKLPLMVSCISLLSTMLLCSVLPATAQTPVKDEDFQRFLVKPERVEETCPLPAFPEGADTTSELRATVLAMVSVDSTGYVRSVNIRSEQPAGMGFGDAVKNVIRDWKYKPAYWGNKPAIYTVTETFYFEKGKVWLQNQDEKKKLKKTPEVKIGQ